jgi:hypothetical protein
LVPQQRTVGFGTEPGACGFESVVPLDRQFAQFGIATGRDTGRLFCLGARLIEFGWISLSGYATTNRR